MLQGLLQGYPRGFIGQVFEIIAEGLAFALVGFIQS